MGSFRLRALALCLVSASAVLCGSCDDEVTAPDQSPCTIVIETFPASLPILWTLTDLDGDVHQGEGNTLLRNLSPGTYTLQWHGLTGWVPPIENPRTRIVGHGETVYFSGTYTRLNETGTLIIDVNPDPLNAPWLLELPDGQQLLGSGQQSYLAVAVGVYRITWGAVAGWETPVPEESLFSLSAGQTVVFGGTYEPIVGSGTGTLRIEVAPESLDAPWSLILPGGATAAGTGAALLPGMPAGSYTIAWGAVDGWLPPSPNPISGVLVAGDELEFEGEFTWVPPTGTIIVNPDPDMIEAPWTLVGPDDYELAGNGDRTLSGLLLGSYTLTWGEVTFYYTPEENPAQGELDEIDPLVFAGEYLPTGDGNRIGIYADPFASITQVTIEPFQIVELYIIAHLPGFDGGRITAAEFSAPSWFDPGPLGLVEIEWNTNMVLGYIFEDVALAFPDGGYLDEHDNVLLATARILSLDAAWPAPDTMILTQGGLYGGPYPVVVDEESNEIGVFGDTLIVNPSGRDH
jgi:hypothetical protein